MNEATPPKLPKRTTGGTPGILSPQQEGAGVYAPQGFSSRREALCTGIQDFPAVAEADLYDDNT